MARGDAPRPCKGATPKRRPRKRKKGGWKSLKGLKWGQVKKVFEFDKLARQAGFTLNAFVTIKADERCSTDQKQKRYLSRKIAHFGQAIKGRGRMPRQTHFVGVTTYEKKLSGVLHAHMLVHVEDFAFAKQWADGDIVKVKRAKSCHLGYLTKQRLPLGPDFEATDWHRRQPSERITGVRISFSSDAKALIAAQRPAAPPAMAPSRQRPLEIHAA